MKKEIRVWERTR